MVTSLHEHLWLWQATVDLAAMDVNSISYLESAKRMRTLLQVSPLYLSNTFHTFIFRMQLNHSLSSEFLLVAVYFFSKNFTHHTLNGQTGLLRHTDLNNNPERFFLAHRLLARHAPASILRLLLLKSNAFFFSRFCKSACFPNAFSGACIRWAFL